MYPTKTTASRHKPRHLQESTLPEAARRIAYAKERERWEQLNQMALVIDRSLSLYFSGVRHPAEKDGLSDWLDQLIQADETLSGWMAECIDKLTSLSEVR